MCLILLFAIICFIPSNMNWNNRDSILGNVPGVVVPTVSTAANTTAAAVNCNTNGTAAATNGCSGVAAMAAAASNNRIRQLLKFF